MQTVMGWAGADPAERGRLYAALALGLTLAALPFLLHVLVDTDRAVPAAFLPAVWLGWKIVRPAHPADAWLLGWAVLAMLVATAFANHAARSLVMIAAVGWTIAGGCVARKITPSPHAVRTLLVGIAAGASLGMILVVVGFGAHRMSFPTYGSARIFGAHQFVGALAVLALLVSLPAKSRIGKIITACAATAIWTGLMWSGGRAPVVALIVALACWIWRGTASERLRIALWAPALIVIGLAFSYPLGKPYPQLGWWEAVSRTIEASSVQAASSDRSRFWAATWNEITRSPWIGHGADSYLYIQPAQNGSQPHNALLQWLLEYGLFGAIPIVLLLMRSLAGLWPRRGPAITATLPYSASSSATVAGALAYGLLEGVFYHAVVFMPVAVMVGIALGEANSVPRHHPKASLQALARGGLITALILLVVHNWLYLVLLRGRTIGPDSIPARVLQAFPSTTYALQNWLDRWRRTDPDVVMKWLKWAQNESTQSATFHLYAAQLHIWKKDFKSAEAELLRCLDKVHYLERPDVLEVIGNVRRLAAEESSAREARQEPSSLPASSDR